MTNVRLGKLIPGMRVWSVVDVTNFRPTEIVVTPENRKSIIEGYGVDYFFCKRTAVYAAQKNNSRWIEGWKQEIILGNAFEAMKKSVYAEALKKYVAEGYNEEDADFNAHYDVCIWEDAHKEEYTIPFVPFQLRNRSLTLAL